MNIEQFSTFVKTLQARQFDVLISKNHDYAKQNDVFCNFKHSATVAGITPEQSCLVLMGTKQARLTELLTSGKKPNNEAIDDSVLDLANYCLLLLGIINEGRTHGEKLNE